MPAGIIKWFCEQVNLENDELGEGESLPPTGALTGENVYSISQIYLIMKIYYH